MDFSPCKKNIFSLCTLNSFAVGEYFLAPFSVWHYSSKIQILYFPPWHFAHVLSFPIKISAAVPNWTWGLERPFYSKVGYQQACQWEGCHWKWGLAVHLCALPRASMRSLHKAPLCVGQVRAPLQEFRQVRLFGNTWPCNRAVSICCLLPQSRGGGWGQEMQDKKFRARSA